VIEVLAKGLGKNVDEAAVKCWYFNEGDSVTAGDDLVDLRTEDSDVTIPVPVTGVIAEIFFDEGETVQRDEVLCIIDDEAELEEEAEEGEDGETEEEPDEESEDEEI
jgi:2-oxoglutarate dehydrogenase E2 component (dihydrolipoamide succinyltransferase)